MIAPSIVGATRSCQQALHNASGELLVDVGFTSPSRSPTSIASASDARRAHDRRDGREDATDPVLVPPTVLAACRPIRYCDPRASSARQPSQRPQWQGRLSGPVPLLHGAASRLAGPHPRQVKLIAAVRELGPVDVCDRLRVVQRPEFGVEPDGNRDQSWPADSY
jgi:hypothetical protein